MTSKYTKIVIRRRLGELADKWKGLQSRIEGENKILRQHKAIRDELVQQRDQLLVERQALENDTQ